MKFEKEEEQLKQDSLGNNNNTGNGFRKILQENRERIMKKMEFLVRPVTPLCFPFICLRLILHYLLQRGLFITFLENGSMYHNHEVKAEILTFLAKIFADPQAGYVRRKAYIDTYIPYVLPDRVILLKPKACSL